MTRKFSKRIAIAAMNAITDVYELHGPLFVGALVAELILVVIAVVSGHQGLLIAAGIGGALIYRWLWK
ncbi:MAG TPA: hypothetical protein VGE09_06545 [Pseudoxanthomonas sp.]